MKSHQSKKSGSKCRDFLRVAGVVLTASSLLLARPVLAADYSITGESNTILRMRTTIDKKDVYPLYEYLRLSVATTGRDGSAAALHFGGWGRADLGEKSSRDGYTDADLQFYYISFQGPKNNLVFNVGRQFVSEGVAAQRLDGFYLRNDFAGGFSAAAYAGWPVVTEPSLKGDDYVFGGRVTQSDNRYYTLGVSALKSYSDSARYREEEGVDLWLHPVKQVDITGRSSYNSITQGWMEHAYTASYVPADNLRLYLDLSRINYKDYFYKVTTAAFLFNPLTNGIDPNEELLALGGGGSYALTPNVTVAADYKRYDYARNQDADYYGGKVSYAIPDSFGAGLAVHRMDGKADRLKYTEYRFYATKRVSKSTLTLDLMDLNYDKPAAMNDVRNVITVVGGGSYDLSNSLQLGASIDYSRNPLFDNEVKGLVKLTYLFDVKRSAEGGTSSEK